MTHSWDGLLPGEADTSIAFFCELAMQAGRGYVLPDRLKTDEALYFGFRRNPVSSETRQCFLDRSLLYEYAGFENLARVARRCLLLDVDHNWNYRIAVSSDCALRMLDETNLDLERKKEIKQLVNAFLEEAKLPFMRYRQVDDVPLSE